MSEIKLIKINDTYLKVLAEKSIMQEMASFFTFQVPGARFQKAVKEKLWDGNIRLLNLSNHLIYLGLYEKILDFAQKSGYTIAHDSYKPTTYPISLESVEKYIKEVLKPASKGKEITVRGYQTEVVHHCISNQRATIISPTSSGKSLMIYSLVRYLLGAKLACRVLFIFPTVGLVSQMASDFVDYSSVNGWDVESRSHLIFAGQEKITNHQLVFSTYQSLTKMPTKYFNSFDVIICDEVHTAAAKSIKDIMEKSTEVQYKFGFTGTLNEAKCHSLVVQGLFGEAHIATTTNELMKKNEISQLKITCLLLKYSIETCKLFKEVNYADEIEYIVTNMKRIKFIKNLVTSLKGNSLILFTRISQGKLILDSLKGRDNIHYVDGSTSIENREKVRAIAESTNDCIIVASYGVFSTGINIKRLNNIIFGSPYKSSIKVRQSLGRVLRLCEGKDGAQLFDVADDLHYKSHKNFGLKHLEERVRFYCEDKLKYKIIEYQLEK